MRFTVATCVIALVVSAAAAPQPPKTGMAIPITKRDLGFVDVDGSINIDKINAHVASVKAKFLRGLRNYELNTGMVHPSAPNVTQKRGPVALTDVGNGLWYGAISVGTPPQSLTADFDTGSTDLILPSTICDSSCAGQTLYNPWSSSTAQGQGQSFSESYGDGSTLSGEVYLDTVAVGGSAVTGQSIGAIKTGTGFSKNVFPSGGLMGLAFQPISRFGAGSVLQNLITEGQVAEPVVSFKLSSSGSELFVGGSNTALYSGEFAYAAVTQIGYWEVNMDNIQSNGNPILGGIDVIIDTGTAIILAPTDQAAKLYNAIGGKPALSPYPEGYYTLPCSSFPTISLTFGGSSFPILPSAINLTPTAYDPSQCLSAIVGQSSFSFWIVGDTFLRGVYTTFDFRGPRVGFAPLT